MGSINESEEQRALRLSRPGWIRRSDGTAANEADGINDDGSWNMNMSTALTSSVDTMNVDMMGKGGTVTVFNPPITATTTSQPVDLGNHKHVSFEVVVSAITVGDWVVELLGCNLAAGAFGPIHKLKDDGSFIALKTPEISENGTYIFEFMNIGVRYLKLRAICTNNGTITVRTTPYN